MTGVFDSGRGAYNTAEFLKVLLPTEPVRILTDRANAPFGTKSREELLPILRSNLLRLDSLGANIKLVACCTMSSLLPYLNEEERRGALGVVEPTARAALRLTRNGRIAVIATERTVSEGAFSKQITGLTPSVAVTELVASELVGIAERGGPLSREDGDEIARVCRLVRACSADTLILGCTHFSSLRKQIKSLLPDILIADSAREGAAALVPYIKTKEKKKWQNTEEEELTRR